jgi:hypothetical protein
MKILDIPKDEQGVWSWMRFGRLLIDIGLFLFILIFLAHHKTTTQLAENGAYTNDLSNFYSTNKTDIARVYNKYIGNDVHKETGKSNPKVAWADATGTSLSSAALFHDDMNCKATPTQEMCVCVAAATSWEIVHNCLLQNSTPMRLNPMFKLSMLSVVLMWFGLSTASSLMMFDEMSLGPLKGRYSLWAGVALFVGVVRPPVVQMVKVLRGPS